MCRLWVDTCMTIFVGQEMVNFPAPQKLDPKISHHGVHAVFSTCRKKVLTLNWWTWKTLVKKRTKHCTLLRFLLLPRTKQPISDVFSPSEPQNRAKALVSTLFCNNQKSKCSQNTAVCDTLAAQHVRNSVFYSVFGPPLQKHLPKHWYLQCF